MTKTGERGALAIWSLLKKEMTSVVVYSGEGETSFSVRFPKARYYGHWQCGRGRKGRRRRRKFIYNARHAAENAPTTSCC